MSQQAHVGPEAPCERDRRRAVRGFADDLDVGLGVQDHAEPRADEVLVVGDQHAHRHVVHRFLGSDAVARHPPPGEGRPRRAAQSAARSRIPRDAESGRDGGRLGTVVGASRCTATVVDAHVHVRGWRCAHADAAFVTAS